MEPVKIGQILCCDKCGVELEVVRDCDSTCVCSIVCCGQTMRLKESREGEKAAGKRPGCC